MKMRINVECLLQIQILWVLVFFIHDRHRYLDYEMLHVPCLKKTIIIGTNLLMVLAGLTKDYVV